MRRFLFLTLCATCVTAIAAFDEIKVYVNGELEKRGGMPPILRNGRTLLFLRDTFNRLDTPMMWYPSEQRIKAWHGEREIELWIGNNEAMIDGRTITMDQPPILEKYPNRPGSATMVPLRFISEALGATVLYTGSQNRVDIDTSTMPLFNEKARFKVGDEVEVLLYPKDQWARGKVIKVIEWADKPDNYTVEYTEPSGRVMRPSLRRTYVRAPKG